MTRIRPWRRPIRLYWWRHRDPTILNVGDELSAAIVALVSGRSVERASLDRCDLAAAGSILDAAIATTGRSPIPVWGSGLLVDRRPGPAPTIAAAAVRGPASAERLTGTERLAQGDPVLLADRLLARRPGVRWRLGIVPHYVDLGSPSVAAWAATPGVRVISTLQAPLPFVTEIASCAAIVSSSLHGLVAADALGVPNRWITLSDGLMGGGFKFRDHLRAMGEERLEPLPMPPSGPLDAATIEAVADGYRRPGLEAIKERLVSVFPS